MVTMLNHSTPLTAPNFKGCLHPGSRLRRIEAWVMDINDKPGQDWRLLCESTPFTWKRITYSSPTHCEARVSVIPTRVLRRHLQRQLIAGFQVFGKKFAMWDIFDISC